MCYDRIGETELTCPSDPALMCALRWFPGSSQGDHPSLPAKPGPLVTLNQAPAPRAVACPGPVSADPPVVGVSQKRLAPLSRRAVPSHRVFAAAALPSLGFSSLEGAVLLACLLARRLPVRTPLAGWCLLEGSTASL